jgi:hypothetical protein
MPVTEAGCLNLQHGAAQVAIQLHGGQHGNVRPAEVIQGASGRNHPNRQSGVFHDLAELTTIENGRVGGVHAGLSEVFQGGR